MKKVVLTTFILFLTLSICSQEKEVNKKEKLKFGVAGGFDLILFTNHTGLSFGNLNNRIEISEPSTSYVNLFLEKSLSKKYSLRTEVLYAMGGGASNTLEIPIIFKYKAFKKLNFYAGAQANFLLIEKNEYSNRAGFGFNFGIEYNINEHFFIDLRYVHKFSQMKSSVRREDAINSIRLGVGYRF